MPIFGKRRAKPAHAPVRATVESLEDRTLFAFGVTTGTTPTGQTTYVIDNGTDVKFSVVKGGTLSSTIHLGDVSSIKYKNQELLAPYSTTSRYSHYEQGLGSTTSVTYAVGGNNTWILVTCDDSAESSGGVIQYYAVRKGDDNIYMASLPTDVNNGPGEGRFIAYLNRSVFITPETPSDNSGSGGWIEGSDVWGHPDGTTSSKFYDMNRMMIDNVYHGLTGTAGTTPVGAWMFMGNRETSSGGPFFKDIDYQSWDGWVEMYNCLFTGHTQTEPFRQGLKGPYALQLNGGSTPTTPDYSWLQTITDASGNLLIHGLVPAAQRGALAGAASGVPSGSGHPVTVALSNTSAQYWGTPDSTGKYTIQGILPGTYTETLYDNELEVGRKTVTITAGTTTNANIVDTFYIPSSPIFRIGTWDGTPLGFLNTQADPVSGLPLISIMHPSDVRMSSWTATPNFVVGSNTDAQWPLAQWMGVNNNQQITFNLTSSQVQNLTLRIGITWGFAGARPQVTVNSGQSYAWTSTIPTASDNLNSRGITRGTWRGDNQLYTFNIPASAFRAGTNTINLPLVSGSYVSGQTWLSPNVAYDAIDLAPTARASAPAIASVTVTPVNSGVGVNGTRTFTAVAKDASGNVIPANIDWSAARGTIDANGNYVAPATAGSDTITATATTTGTPGYSTTSRSTSAFTGTVSGTGSTTINVVAPPSLLSFQINDGSAQRSMVDSLTLKFSQPVTPGAGALTLALHPSVNGGGPVGTLPALSWSSSDGGLSYVVRFSGNGVVGNSIADGGYDLTVHAPLVQDAYGQSLSGGDQSFTLFRLYGDLNGDATVNGSDYFAFRQALGSGSGDAAYAPAFDYNADGAINGTDYFQFRQRLGQSLVLS